MAKRRGRKSKDRLGDAAASFGTVLGGIAAKVDHINKQRADVAKELEGFVKQAQGMMKGLSKIEIPFPKTRAAVTKEIVEPVRRKMSAKARKAISEAQKKRWAKTKATATKAFTKAKKAATK